MDSSFEFIKDLPKSGVGLYKCNLCGFIQTKHKHSIKIGRKSICLGCQQIKLETHTKRGWTFKRRCGEKATYEHTCGREQDIDIHQMSKGLVVCGACDMDSVVNQASDKGFDVLQLVGEDFHCSCKTCNTIVILKRYLITRKSAIRCTGCQEKIWKQNCAGKDWTFVSRVDGNYGVYSHTCGNTQIVKHSHVQRQKPVCKHCVERDKSSAATKHGWRWVHKHDRKSSLYEHNCGNQQVFQDVHMRNGSIKCHGCNQSWLDKGSNIYVIRLSSDKQGVSFLKLGIAYDFQRRVRSFKLGPDFVVDLIELIPFENGKEAVAVEKSAHSFLRQSGTGTFDASAYLFSGHTECYSDTDENVCSLLEAVHRSRKPKTTQATRVLLLS